MGAIFCTFLIRLLFIFHPLSQFFLELQSLITYHQQKFSWMQCSSGPYVTTFAVQLMVLKLILSNEDKYNTIPSLTQPHRLLIQIPSHQPRSELNPSNACSWSYLHLIYLYLDKTLFTYCRTFYLGHISKKNLSSHRAKHIPRKYDCLLCLCFCAKLSRVNME